jgi:hypothetical protein
MSILLVLFALIHLFFITAYSLLWFGLSGQKQQHNLFKLLILVGIPVNLVFDFFGLKVFYLWHYQSTNLYEYALIGAVTYIPLVPLALSMTNYFYERLQINFYQVAKLPKYFHLIEFVLGVGLTAAISYWRYEQGNSYARLMFFGLITIGILVGSDGLMGLLGKTGVVTRTLTKNNFTLVAYILVGILIGLPWEVLNTYFPLWTYINLPGVQVVGVPLIVILLWLMFAVGYELTLAVIDVIFSNLLRRTKAI